VAIDTESLLEAARGIACIGDNAWNKDYFSGIPNRKTAEVWLLQDSKLALKSWDIPCLQKRLRTEDNTINLMQDGLAVIIPANFISFKTGFVGDANLNIWQLSDIIDQEKEDTGTDVYAYHSLDDDAGEIWKFASDKSDEDIDIAIYVHPKHPKYLPDDLEKYLLYMLAKRMILFSQNANLDGVYTQLELDLQGQEKMLKARYAKKSRSFDNPTNPGHFQYENWDNTHFMGDLK
jgi:hypothetical protein